MSIPPFSPTPTGPALTSVLSAESVVLIQSQVLVRVERPSSIISASWGLRRSVIKMSYKKECQEIFLSVGSVPTLFLSRHSAQPFERALAIGEWSCSGDVVSCFVSSHETVRSLFLPVVPFHCRDGAHSFLETDKRNDCRVANHGPI